MRTAGFLALSLCGGLLASQAVAHGGHDAALADLDRRVDASAVDVDALAERAALHRLRGEFAAALADLNDLYDRDPELPRQCLERALVFRDLGQREAARADLEQFLEHDPKSLTGLVALAEIVEAEGDLQGALKLRRRALAVAPTVATYTSACAIEEKLDLDEAAACYTKGLGVLHEAVVLKRALVRVETKRRRYDRAIALLDGLIQNSALRADAYLDRADVHEAAGHHGKAQSDRRRALEAIDEALQRKDTPMRRATRRRARRVLGLDPPPKKKGEDDEPMLSRGDLVEARAALRDGSLLEP